jgi:O-antigen/teichoic acid export membrane protein
MSEPSAAAPRSDPPAAPAPRREGRVAWEAITNVVAQAIMIAALVLATPLLVRALGPERYGAFNVITVVMAYLVNLDLGLARASTKYIPEAMARGAEERARSVFWMVLTTVTALAVVGSLALAAGAPVLLNAFEMPLGLRQESTEALRVAAVAVAGTVATMPLVNALAAHRRFTLMNSVRVPSTVLTTLLPLAGIAMGFGLPGILWLLALKAWVAAAAALFLCWRYLPPTRPGFRWDGTLARQLIGFGAWTLFLQAGPMLTGSADRLIVGAAVGLAAVTYYGIPQQVTNALKGMLDGVRAVLFTRFSELNASDPRHLETLHRRAVECVGLGLGLVCFVVAGCAEELIAFWMGPGFEASAPILKAFTVGAFFFSLSMVTGEMLQAAGHIRAVVQVTVFVTALHAGLIFAFLPLGLAGAAAAAPASQAVGTLLLAWLGHRRGLVSLRGFLPARTAVGCGLLAAAGVAVAVVKPVLHPDPHILLPSLAAVTVAFGSLAALFALERETRAALAASLGPLWTGVRRRLGG